MKNKSIMSSLILVPAVLLSACDKKSDSKPAGASVPTTLGWQKPTPGVKLSKTQLQSIRTAFAAQKAAMILPPGELIFIPQSMTKEEQLRKERELKAADTNAYLLLQDIRKGCQKGRPTFHIEATFPVDQADPRESIRAGDYLSYSGSAGLGGQGCPVDLALSGGASVRAEERDLAADTGKAMAGVNSDIRAIMNNPRYAQLLGTRGLVVQSAISGIVMAREIMKDQPIARMSLQVNMTGSYLSLKQEVPFTSTMNVISFENGGAESLMRATVQMTDFKFELEVHSIQTMKNGPQDSQMFINGHPMNQEDYDNLFGKNSPAMAASTATSTLN